MADSGYRSLGDAAAASQPNLSTDVEQDHFSVTSKLTAAALLGAAGAVYLATRGRGAEISEDIAKLAFGRGTNDASLVGDALRSVEQTGKSDVLLRAGSSDILTAGSSDLKATSAPVTAFTRASEVDADVSASRTLRSFAPVGALTLAALTLAGCGDSDSVSNSQPTPPADTSVNNYVPSTPDVTTTDQTPAPVATPTEPEQVQTTVFQSVADCTQGGFDENECKAQYDTALANHQLNSQSFSSQAQCEADSNATCGPDTTAAAQPAAPTDGQAVAQAPAQVVTPDGTVVNMPPQDAVVVSTWRPIMYGYLMPGYPGMTPGYYTHVPSMPVYSRGSSIVTIHGDTLQRTGNSIVVPSTVYRRTTGSVPLVHAPEIGGSNSRVRAPGSTGVDHSVGINERVSAPRAPSVRTESPHVSAPRISSPSFHSSSGSSS